jgi:hypothetical protein
LVDKLNPLQVAPICLNVQAAIAGCAQTNCTIV